MPYPKALTLTPTALDRNGITTSETLVAARLSLLMNGALVTGYDRDGIATSQTPTGADAMTLDGALGNDYFERRGTYVNIYAAADDSGRTFTVDGLDKDGRAITEDITGPGLGLITMGATKFYAITAVTPDAATAGAIEIGVSGYAEFTTPQHITIFNAGDDTGDTFTVTGEDRYGADLTETITGGNAATVAGTKNFARVYRVSSSGASAAGVEVGVNGLCESQWYVLNYRGPDFNVGLGAEISSGADLTYDVEHTFDNIFASDFTEDGATVYNHDTMASQTANSDGNYTNPPTATRLAITAHTSGSATLNIIQAGRA